MNQGKLLRFSVERFKSFEQETEIRFKPLTVILGRNNSGKSSLIQSLLLLKQTLREPRSEVPLHLEGDVAAFNLRELTFGWPTTGEAIPGPSFRLRWSCRIDVSTALEEAKWPDLDNLFRWTTELSDDFRSLVENHDEGQQQVVSEIRFSTEDRAGTTAITEILLKSPKLSKMTMFHLVRKDGGWNCRFGHRNADKIEVELDHFLPYLQLDRRNVGPRHRQRAWHNAYLILFAQPIEALKSILTGFQYLGSTRTLPPSLYKSSNVAPQEIGASGELAAQLLHRRQREVVHFLPPLDVESSEVSSGTEVRELPLVDAVNEVLSSLSIRAPLSVEEIHEIGFRLLFGSASLSHVGRGLTYLLPLVELGLFADPAKFRSIGDNLSLTDYRSLCEGWAHVAIEEPEAHLHPKVQSRLAHWLVSLAMSNRRLLIETHSDHLVRRLRGLAARAGRESQLENWLIKNVSILEVEQDSQGRTSVNPCSLTPDGGIGDRWPADFMDESSNEDSAIYYAGMAKASSGSPTTPQIVHDEGPVPDSETEF